jgi:hypothetical protein
MIIEEILPVSGAARRAREIVTEACARWEIPRLADPACVIATELVANAVRHARTLIELHVLLRPRHLCLAVRDGSSRPPRPRHPHRDGGRGLALVDAFSLAWGHLPTSRGKVVWATLNR